MDKKNEATTTSINLNITQTADRLISQLHEAFTQFILLPVVIRTFSNIIFQKLFIKRVSLESSDVASSFLLLVRNESCIV